MLTYVINLDSAPERWAHVRRFFSENEFRLQRVSAVDGRTLNLSAAGYDERRYHLFHGRYTNPAEVGCYLSHLDAMERFLATGERCALVCEDDISVIGPLERIVAAAMSHVSNWNIVRLAGLSKGKAIPVRTLEEGWTLTKPLGRMKGTGAYLIDRDAAACLVERLRPMWLPFDHALDRAFVYGLRAVAVQPFPIEQNERIFRSSIQKTSRRKLPASRRWLTTYPYQALNETARWAANAIQVMRWWRCYGDGA